MAIPAGNEAARAFVPAKDFAVSKAFYEALGFPKLMDGELALFAAGSGSFFLQNFYEPQHAGNFVMQLMVDDVDAWWAHVQSLDLPGRFGVKEPRAPAVQPWGLKVSYLFDPAGVLWHIAERRPGKPQDQ